MDDLDIEAQRRITSFVNGVDALLRQVLREQQRRTRRPAAAKPEGLQDELGPSDAVWVEPDVVDLAAPQARELCAALLEHLKGEPAPIKAWLGLAQGRAGRPSPSRRQKALEILEFKQLLADGVDRNRAAKAVGRDQTTFSRWLRQDLELRDLVETVEKLDERSSAVAPEQARRRGRNRRNRP